MDSNDRAADLGWAAGFFDGEGCVRYYRQLNNKTSTVSPILTATVPQNVDNREVLDKFIRIIGFGVIRGPYLFAKCWQLRILYGVKEVEPLFLILSPHLGTAKRDDFIKAIEQYNNHDPNVTDEDMKKVMKSKTKMPKDERIYLKHLLRQSKPERAVTTTINRIVKKHDKTDVWKIIGGIDNE